MDDFFSAMRWTRLCWSFSMQWVREQRVREVLFFSVSPPHPTAIPAGPLNFSQLSLPYSPRFPPRCSGRPHTVPRREVHEVCFHVYRPFMGVYARTVASQAQTAALAAHPNMHIEPLCSCVLCCLHIVILVPLLGNEWTV